MGPQGPQPDLRVPRPPSQGPRPEGQAPASGCGETSGTGRPGQLDGEPLPERRAPALSCRQRVLLTSEGLPTWP